MSIWKNFKNIQLDPVKIEGKYYRGRIAKFNPSTGYGFVEMPRGTHIFFYVDQIRLEGDKIRKSDIRPGKTVARLAIRKNKNLSLLKAVEEENQTRRLILDSH